MTSLMHGVPLTTESPVHVPALAHEKTSTPPIAPTTLAPEPCTNPFGCFCASKGGPTSCKILSDFISLQVPVGTTLPRSFFSGSPQEHALLNRHLVDYFNGRSRAQESTPYAIPPSQRHLLAPLGMEQPQPDAPEAPHALHKSIEEFQLRRLRNYLTPHQYGIISVKSSKLSLLPPAGSVQNPVYEAKDASRYPGTAVAHASLSDYPTMLMHDVASVVTPHELVERLSSDNPEGHLFVTGMNPVEVLDRAATFEPASHMIDYDLGNFNFIFTESESESYSTPIAVTESWLRTSSVCASNGRVYHVVLLEYKLGHCLWHIFCGDATEQDTRTFSTGSFIQLPASITGTLSGEYLPAKVLTGILDFVNRTPDLSGRNLAAKVTQLANGINPRTTARERWIAVHIAQQLSPTKTWAWWAKHILWNTLYALSFQWQMLKPQPDIYGYIDERKRYRVIHPTPGGGWSKSVAPTYVKRSIPNSPSALQRLSAFTGSVFTFLVPKIVIGEVISQVFLKLPLYSVFKHLIQWADVKPLRLVLTAAIICVTAVLPGHLVKIFSRLAGHFWRQLWFPGWVHGLFERIITEITGAPGHTLLALLPGRGWSWQLYIWMLGAHTVLPGLIPPIAIPWIAWHTGWFLWTILALSAVAFENLLVYSHDWTEAPDMVFPRYHCSLITGYIGDIEQSSMADYGWALAFWNDVNSCFWLFYSGILRAVSVALGLMTIHQRNTGNCLRLPMLPAIPRATVTSPVRRNVDIPMPPVQIQPSNIPGAPPGVALAVDPAGLLFRDWLAMVERAYQANPRAYPQLTPGQACFWDCVAHYGGTAHMWYSWYMAFMSKTPDPTNPVVGNVTVPEMQVFCAASKFGLNLVGKLEQLPHPSGNDWPTMHLRIERSLVGWGYHVTIASPDVSTLPVSAFARILKTIRIDHPQWEAQFIRDFNASPADALPTPTADALAIAGIHQLPQTRTQLTDAIIASYAANPIAMVRQEGFAYDTVNGYAAPYNHLYHYGLPFGNAPVAYTPPATMWMKFRSVQRKLRLLVPRSYAHPLAEPDAKVGATSGQTRDNQARNNQRPNVSMWSTLQSELRAQTTDYDGYSLPAVQLSEETLSYTADVARASRLSADIRAHPSVLETRADPSVIQSLDAIVDLARIERKTVTVPVRAYLGVWGSGKTTATLAYLKSLTPQQRSLVRIVSHNESLRAQAKAKLDFPELRGYNFPTLASIITEPSAGPIVFDDAGKFWGGILDLVILTNPMVSEIVINGDPAQGQSKFPFRGSQSENDPTAIACIAAIATRYATVTHRGFRLLADTLGVHTTNPIDGHITHSVGPKHDLPVCTASPRYVGVLAGAGREAYTYESVQGEDFKQDMEIDMTGLEGAVLDRTAYVALTRSSTGVYLHMDAANPTTNIRAPPTGSDLMNALVYAMRASNTPSLPAPDGLIKATFYRHLHWSMPLLPWFASVGSEVPAELFQNIIPKSNVHVVEDHSVIEGNVSEEVPSSSGAFDTIGNEVHPFAKEHRELGTTRGMTDQFKEVAFVNPHVHKRSDTPTYFLSVEKRLKTAGKTENIRRMESCPRKDMCDEYDRLVPNPPIWTVEKFEGYIDRAVDEYCSKRTLGAVLNKLNSHDPDRRGRDIKISLKNQVIKKDEKRDKLSAIPGQLIHEYDVLCTLGDAPFALFLEDEIISAFPKNFLFYRRMGPDEFKAAYQRSWRVGNGVHTSDVTRWDVGCDAGVLNFDVHVMRRSKFPEAYIEEYMERRLTSRSQHGPMATMQNSGDRYTWALNSLRRATLASLVCQVTPADTVAINGDDEAIDRMVDALPFKDSPWEFKDQNGMTGEFSGFELGGPTPLYSARGIAYRTLILMSRDPSAQDKWVNYLDLLSHCDLDSPEAVDVANSARQHMHLELFQEYLPSPLRPLFPEVFT